MKQDEIQKFDRFLERDGYEIPLTLAAKIVGAAQSDTTNWRQRNLLPAPARKISGRFAVTRNGVIGLGILAQLAPLVGPDAARGVARELLAGMFGPRPHGLNPTDFVREAIKFTSRREDDDGPTSASWSDFDLTPVSADAIAKGPIPAQTTVILPIGRLVYMWAISIEDAFEASCENG